MFKKSLSVGLIVLFILGMAVSSAYCDDALKKLGRGICNCVTFPFEIFEQMKRINISVYSLANETRAPIGARVRQLQIIARF